MAVRNKNILITRPGEQGELLAEQCRALKHSVCLFPLVEITPVSVDPLLPEGIKAHYNIIVFISPNAIKYGLSVINKHVVYENLAVVGTSSLARLKANKMVCTIYPKNDYTSEGLLEHPALQVMNNKKVLIVRGNAGREKLKNTLEKRGAKVDYLSVYERTIINYSQQEIAQLKQSKIDLVQVSNQQSLECLMPLIKTSPWFENSHWWLLSERTKKSCIQYGITESKCQIIKPGNNAFIKNL